MKIFKKMASFVVLTAMLVAIFAQAPVIGNAASASGTVVLSGSTSMQEMLMAMKEAFEKKNPKATVQLVNVTGSGAGIKDAQQGKVDFGMASRSLTDDEKKTLSYTEIALDAVAIITNKANTLKNITNEQLFGIYTGKIKKWSEIDASLASLGDVVPVSREDGSGTRSCFQDVFSNFFATKLPSGYDKNGTIQATTGGVKSTVAATAGAIGYASLGELDNSTNKVSFNGVTAEKATVVNHQYQFSRPFVLCRLSSRTVSPQAKAFLNFIMSEDGQTVVDKVGNFRIPANEINVSSVTLNKYSATLKKGKSVKVTASVLPKNATNKRVVFSSSDEKVATVNPATGLIKAVGVGTATITAKSDNNGATSTFKVIVK